MEHDGTLVVEILEGIFGNAHAHYDNKSQISFDCPVCSYDLKGLDHGDGKGNLEINYAQHVFKCWSCGETHGTHGHLGRLIDKYGTKKDKEFYELIRPDEFKPKDEKKFEKLKLPQGYTKFKDGNPIHIPYREAYNYLKKRGITDEIIERYDIGYTLEGEFQFRIIVPSYDLKGELNYFVARSWVNEKYKYKNPTAPKELLIFNESRINWGKDIWLVEGVFDGFFVPNSIPLLGKFVSDLLWETLYDKAKARIIICLDGDAWEDAKKIYAKLSGGRLYGKIDIVKLPDEKDLGDLRGVVPENCFVKLERL